MPKRKVAKVNKVTLKVAKKAIRLTPEGRRRVCLSHIGITTFPKCLLKLTNADELDLSRNQIQKLPEDIGMFKALTWLDLHSNKLEAVPESIGKLVGLTYLNLSNNRLTSATLPFTLGRLCNLRSINLGMNQLDSLPPTMVNLVNLQELGLFDNLFVKPPDFLKFMHSLTKLNMNRNPLSYGQEDAKEEKKEAMYLAREGSLCKMCLKKCKEKMQKSRNGGGEGEGVEGDASEKKMMRNYSGLIVPNSVAMLNQDVWRTRKVEEK
ncbi:leucine-rich repeat-containing protein 18 isoform X2 [Thalassophryne amazonica]|nr:leucine-rich repeat-containing protein 18 isoform X2 [Thalassophryne amazonica]